MVLLAGYLLPLVCAAVVCGLVGRSGIGPLDVAGFATTMGTQAPMTLPSPAQHAATAALSFAPWGVLTTAWATLGDELGRRGLLLPKLARHFSFTATAPIRGVAWAAWHVPVMVLADYRHSGAPLWPATTSPSRPSSRRSPARLRSRLTSSMKSASPRPLAGMLVGWLFGRRCAALSPACALHA